MLCTVRNKPRKKRERNAADHAQFSNAREKEKADMIDDHRNDRNQFNNECAHEVLGQGPRRLYYISLRHSDELKISVRSLGISLLASLRFETQRFQYFRHEKTPVSPTPPLFFQFKDRGGYMGENFSVPLLGL